MKIYLITILTICLALMAGCDNSLKEKKQEPNKTDNIGTTITDDDVNISADVEESDYEIQEPTDDEIQEPTDDEIQEFGIISNIEDSGYPMFIITIEFPERQMTLDFNLNIEAISLDMGQLYELQNKYITFYYSSDEDNDIHDIFFNNSSLLGEYAVDIDGCKKIKGILSNADSETMSDLPDVFFVTDEEGYRVAFTYYITQKLVEANGKEITIYYSSRYFNNITYILP